MAVLTGEQKREDFIDLVKDFTALIILADIDDNLRPHDVKVDFDNKNINNDYLRIMLKDHSEFLK